MTAAMTPQRLRLAVRKFASCDGCQLTLLDLEDSLLDVAETFEIVEFAEATSRRSDGPFDVLLVEGSISTAEQAEEIVRLRAATRVLVTIGACATTGGVQALRAWRDHEAMHLAVYPSPQYVDALATSTPVADHVTVDATLHGCPIDPGQLLELLTSLVTGRAPQLTAESVCAECKRRGTPCVLVARNLPCLGPVTRGGCGAICPAFGRGCYGCFGPAPGTGATALAHAWFEDGVSSPEIARLFAGFTPTAPAFRSVIDQHGGPPAPRPSKETP